MLRGQSEILCGDRSGFRATGKCNHVDKDAGSAWDMKKKNYNQDLETLRQPINRKRNRGGSLEEEDYVERKRKKSGKRFHRKPTHKDNFGGE
jgi:hypothetical protein